MTIDPWEKAEECQRALDVCPDLAKRCVLENLRQLWISIGNQKSAGATDWYVQVTDIAKLHTDVLGLRSPSVH
jgi:hypothetical protein